MELQAVLNATGAPEKKDLLVKKGDVFKNPQDGSRKVVESVIHGDDGPVIYASEHAPPGEGLRHDARILGRSPRNFFVDADMKGMEKIDPIQDREPVFYEAYEHHMEMLGNAFSREFFACEKALDTWEARLSSGDDAEKSFFPLARIGMLRERIDAIADEWESIDNRFVSGGRRQIELLNEMRHFSQKEFDGDEELSKWKYDALENLKLEYGDGEPDAILIERGYFRGVLHDKVKRLLEKCHQAKSGKLRISDEVISLPEFKRKVDQLNNSIVGYESRDVDAESAVLEIKSVLDTLTEMEAIAFHSTKNDERENGRHVKKEKSLHRMKRDEPEESTAKKSKGKLPRKANKREMLIESEPSSMIPPTISENGVQLGESPVVPLVAEKIASPSMKNLAESIPVEPKLEKKPEPEKKQDVLSAFKDAIEKEKQFFLDSIRGADSLETLQGIGFGVGRSRKFFVENGDNVSPIVLEFVDKIKVRDKGSALEILNEANGDIKKAWNRKNSSLKTEKKSTPTPDVLAENKNVRDIRPGDVYISRKDPSKEFKIIEDEKAIASGEVAYIPINGGGITRSTKEKLLEYLQAKDGQPMKVVSESISSKEKERGRQVETKLIQEMELWVRDIQKIKTKEEFSELTERAARNGKYSNGSAPGFVVGKFLADLLREQGITSDREKDRLKKSAFNLQGQIAPVYLAKRSEVYPSKKTHPEAVAIAVPPENLAESLARTYDELFELARKNGDALILSGGIVKGVNGAEKDAKENGIDLAEYHKEHPQDIPDTLLESMRKSFAHIGKELGWSEGEVEIFARGLIQKNIEEFFK